jgi:hypothetical protein
MARGQNRVLHLNLGMVLGWQQQGAAFGGRPVPYMIEGFDMIAATAVQGGYSGYESAVALALKKLRAGQKPSAVLPEINGLVVFFQQHAGAYVAALNLGLVLGWLQEGARANSRPVSMAIADLKNIPATAAAAGYQGYEGWVSTMLGMLQQGFQVKDIVLQVTALIGLLQGQDIDAPEPDPNPGTFRIDARSFCMVAGEAQVFTIAPPASGPVTWSSSDATILAPTGQSGQFQARSTGHATLTATIGSARTEADVVVRKSATTGALRPWKSSDVVTDPDSRARYVRGRVIVVFRRDVDDPTRQSILRSLGLKVIGVAPEVDIYQVQVPASEPNERVWIDRLNADSRVAVASFDALADVAGRADHITALAPDKVLAVSNVADRLSKFWNLGKIEAYDAFGLLKEQGFLTAAQQTIAVLDGGLFVSPTGDFDSNFDSQVDLKSCLFIKDARVSDATTLGAAGLKRALADPGSDPPAGSSVRVRHGNNIAGHIVSNWQTPKLGVPGLFPSARVAMLRAVAGSNGSVLLADLSVGLHYASLRGNLKVINISFGNALNDASEVTRQNKILEESVRSLITRGFLVVFASSDDGYPIRKMAITSVGDLLDPPPEGSGAIVVVGGTKLASADNPEGPEIQWPESGFDPPDGNPPLVNCAAPSDRIVVTNGDGYFAAPGTSYAAPAVASVAAWVFAILPSKTAQEVKQILLDTVDRITYVSGSYPKPGTRLQAPADQRMGEGRINAWRTVLHALNLASTDRARYVGLRFHATRKDLQINLRWSGLGAVQKLDQLTTEDRPDSLKAVRVTVTNREHNAEFPRTLEALDDANQPVWAIDVAFDRVDEWGARCIRRINVVLALSNDLQLSEDRPGGNQLKLQLKNTGTRPTNPGFLDAARQEPDEPSYRPWMRLADGDSYALKAEAVEGPAGIRFSFLDASLTPFPADRVDDFGNPYITVPFGEIATLHVRADGGPAVKGTVRCRVTAWSLNNNLARNAVEGTLDLGGDDPFVIEERPSALVAPAAWRPFWAVRIHYRGPNRRRLWEYVTMSPATWSSHVSPGYDEWYLPGQTREHDIEFRPGHAAPRKAKCDIEMRTYEPGPIYRRAFEVEVAPDPVVVLSPEESVAQSVKPLPGSRDHYADFPLTITNRSGYHIRVNGKAHDLGNHIGERFELRSQAGIANQDIVIPAGSAVTVTGRFLVPPSNMMPPPNTPITTRPTIRLHILQASRMATESPQAPGASYTTNTIRFSIKCARP